MKRSYAFTFLMNSLMVIFAYFGFIEGDKTAATLASVMMLLCAFMAGIIVMTMHKLPEAHQKAVQEGDKEKEKVFVKAGAHMVIKAKQISLWREFAWDIPVAAMAFIGGAYIVGLLFTLHIVGYIHFKQHVTQHTNKETT